MFLNRRTFIFLSIIVISIVGVGTAEALTYRSYVFNTYDIILFSYEDGTQLAVYRYGESKYSGTLDKGQHVRIVIPYPYNPVGAFEVAGSKKFSVLIGDPTYGKSGYYAMDQNGLGVSTEFYTYVPPKTPSYGYQKFVVFAYEDGTELTVEYADPNMVYHEVVTNHPLDAGGHWKSEELSGKYVHVTANKPVSALSCYDTGYFVPSADGKFSGTKFYTYIGKTKSGFEHLPQDLIVAAYDDNTLITISDCNEPGVEKWQGSLHADEVHVQRFRDGLNEPVSVTSSLPVTVSVQQWVTDEADWVAQGFFVPGQDGTGFGGFGRDIIVPVRTWGYLAIMAYTNNTHVKVYNAETGLLFKPYTIHADDPMIDNIGNGLWRIVSDKPVLVHAGIESKPGYGQFYYNAEFAPLLFDVTAGDMVKVSVKAGLGDCTEPEDPNHCFEPADPNNNELCYKIAYWSDPNDDTDVVITDYLPSEVEFILSDPNTGLYDPNNHTYTWDIGTVTGGDPCSYCYIKVRVTEYAQPGQKITNKVQLSSHTSYYTDEVSTPVCCPPEPIIYVKADASGFRNGSSWADAYTTLQPALTRAMAGFGSEIWVAEGIYHPSKYIIRTLIELLDGVEIYGGFAGDETSRDGRDFIRNKTYLSGDIDEQGDNDSFGVVYAGWGIDNSVLDGFVITKGDEWAGLYCYVFSMPTIRNCVIRKNRDHGIICSAASPRIYDCRIEENDGSGLYSVNVDDVWLLAGLMIV